MIDLEAGLENSRTALRTLLIGWKTSNRGGYDVPVDRETTAHMVIPWAVQVHRFGRAFLQLEKVAMEHEGHPLVRSALEYTVVGHWAAHVGHNAVVARYGKDQDRLQALVKDVQGSPHDVVPPQWKPEMFAAAVDPDQVPVVDETKMIDNFEQICRDIGLHGTLYPMYRVLCWVTHPTTQAAHVYVDESGGISDVPLYSQKRPVGLVGMMAFAVLWSRRTVDDLTVGHPYREWLDEIAQSIDARLRLPAPRAFREANAG